MSAVGLLIRGFGGERGRKGACRFGRAVRAACVPGSRARQRPLRPEHVPKVNIVLVRLRGRSYSGSVIAHCGLRPNFSGRHRAWRQLATKQKRSSFEFSLRDDIDRGDHITN